MSCGHECDLCVRVECESTYSRFGLGWPAAPRGCGWSGYRPKSKANDPCPWCRKSIFLVLPVHHRMGGGCTAARRRWIERLKA